MLVVKKNAACRKLGGIFLFVLFNSSCHILHDNWEALPLISRKEKSVTWLACQCVCYLGSPFTEQAPWRQYGYFVFGFNFLYAYLFSLPSWLSGKRVNRNILVQKPNLVISNVPLDIRRPLQQHLILASVATYSVVILQRWFCVYSIQFSPRLVNTRNARCVKHATSWTPRKWHPGRHNPALCIYKWLQMLAKLISSYLLH